MKFLSVVFCIALVIMTPMAFAVENGVGVRNASVTLYNQATGSLSLTRSSAYTFDQVMKYLACDFISSASTTTGSTTFAVYGNQGSSTTLFEEALIGSTSVASSLSVSVITTNVSNSGVAFPFRTIRAEITAPTTTQIIQINCSAVQ